MKTTTLCFVAFSLIGVSSTAHAQLGTPNYTLRNRSELRAALLKNARNSRALYDLTILANRAGWLGTVLKTGDEMLAKNRNDTYAQALVAFGVATGLYARFWDWPVDKTVGDVWGRQAMAGYLRGESLRGADPTIQVMAAIALANGPANRNGEFKRAIRLFQTALKRQPNWADAHYWYGRALDRAAAVEGHGQHEKVGSAVLAQFNRAEQLDKTLHNFLQFDKFISLQSVARPREGLDAFNAYLRAYPAFQTYVEENNPGYVAKTRARLAKQIQERTG